MFGTLMRKEAPQDEPQEEKENLPDARDIFYALEDFLKINAGLSRNGSKAGARSIMRLLRRHGVRMTSPPERW